jgi:hypothetical protein
MMMRTTMMTPRGKEHEQNNPTRRVSWCYYYYSKGIVALMLLTKERYYAKILGNVKTWTAGSQQ